MQSNISTHKQKQITKSTGYPTLIKYLGLSFGKRSVQKLTIFQKSSDFFKKKNLKNSFILLTSQSTYSKSIKLFLAHFLPLLDIQK